MSSYSNTILSFPNTLVTDLSPVYSLRWSCFFNTYRSVKFVSLLRNTTGLTPDLPLPELGRGTSVASNQCNIFSFGSTFLGIHVLYLPTFLKPIFFVQLGFFDKYASPYVDTASLRPISVNQNVFPPIVSFVPSKASPIVPIMIPCLFSMLTDGCAPNNIFLGISFSANCGYTFCNVSYSYTYSVVSVV